MKIIDYITNSIKIKQNIILAITFQVINLKLQS